MARRKQVVYSSFSSDEMEVSENIEESVEEMSSSPQSVRGLQGKGTFQSAEVTALIMPSLQVLGIKSGTKHMIILSFSLRCI